MYFDNIEPGDDRLRLAEFIRRIAWFLDTLAESPGDVLKDLNYRAPILREVVSYAWRLEVRPALTEMVERAGNISPARASAVGLSGASLSAKIAIASWWESMIPDLGKKAVSYILKLINSFLGSLAEILGLAEPIKEAKEMLENTLDLD